MIANPYFLGGVALGVTLLFGGIYVYNKGYSNGVDFVNQKITEERLQNQIEVRKKEKLWQQKFNEITLAHENKITNINRKHDAIITSLRNRPSRNEGLPRDSQVSCKGATGAELSREDGEFLTREATRTDKLREALRGCYQMIDEVGG